eukprot:COSAG02_NODE_9177_length_2300_cov_4.630622_2_plen_64_part_00
MDPFTHAVLNVHTSAMATPCWCRKIDIYKNDDIIAYLKVLALANGEINTKIESRSAMSPVFQM